MVWTYVENKAKPHFFVKEGPLQIEVLFKTEFLEIFILSEVLKYELFSND